METADRAHYPAISETDPPLMTAANLSGPPKAPGSGRDVIARPETRMDQRQEDIE